MVQVMVMCQTDSMTCIKYFIFIFSFIFLICGLVLIVVGSVMTKKDMTEFLDKKYVTVPIMLIVVGCVIFVVAFFGCCGALLEIHCMLVTFALLTLVVIVIELSGGIYACMYKGEVQDFLKRNMYTSLRQQRKDSVKIWDEMQTKWKCCGVEGPVDYLNLNLRIPMTCCVDPCCPDQPCPTIYAFHKGCFRQMLDKVDASIATIGGVAIGFAVVQILICMFAWIWAYALRRKIKREDVSIETLPTVNASTNTNVLGSSSQMLLNSSK